MYQSVFNATSVAIGVISTSGKFIDINKPLKEILGYSESELINNEMKNVIHPDEYNDIQDHFNSLLDGSMLFSRGTWRFVNKENETIWGDLHSVPLYDKNKEIKGIIATAIEVTKQNNIDVLLRKQNEGFQSLFQNFNKNAVIVIDEDMNIIRANQMFEQLSGYPLSITNNNSKFPNFIYPEDKEKLETFHSLRRINKSEVPSQYQCRVIYNNGSVYKHLLNVTMIPGTGNSIVSFSDIIPDPPVSRSTSKANLFRMLAENATDMIFIITLEFEIIYISPSVERVTGYSQEEFKLVKAVEYITPESYGTAIKFLTADFLADQDLTQTQKLELQVVNKAGKLIWVETLVKFILNEYGQPVGITGSSRDITERKQAEDFISRSEEKYRLLTEGLKDVVFVISSDLTIEYISPKVSDFSDYLQEEVTGTHISKFFALIEEYEQAFKHFCSCLEKNEPVANFDFLLKNPGTNNFYVEVTANPFYENGKLVMLHCVARDISDRKKVENRLRERGESLSIENLTLKKTIIQNEKLGPLIGKSKAMQKVYDLILKAAPSNANIIIYGESGTGKELAARAIHDISDRQKKPFVVVNCGAIPENIIESEFFGYKKGAFSGAYADKEGFLDLADGGTLFLDEIGEICLSMQVKLLRAIEGGGYSPLGSNEVKKPSLHIVAATNRNLNQLVAENKMREDFFFRIHVIPLNMPPLRERRDDIPLLMEHFLSLYREKNVAANIPVKVKRAFMNYRWPGNVRELQNMLYRYLALNKIDFSGIYDNNDGNSHFQKEIISQDSTLSKMVERFERDVLTSVLDKNRWHKSKTALTLNIDRKTLSSKIKKYELSPD